MPIGRGAAKQLRIKRNAVKGTRVTGGTGGQIVRRNTSNFELAKDTFTTEAEQTSSRQINYAGYGARMVNVSYSGIFSPGTQSDMLSALLMRDFTKTLAADLTGLSLTIAGTGPTYTLTRGAGSWLTDGVKIGMGIRLTAAAHNVANKNRNLVVIGVTATVLTIVPANFSQNKVAMVAEGPVAAGIVTFPGGRTFVPTSGHTDVDYTVEEWMSDMPRSQVNDSVKWTSATMRLPGSGPAGIDFSAMGLDQVKDPAGAGTAYFTAPAAETTTGALVAASGVLFVNGVAQSVVTDMTATLDGRGAIADPVVGTPIRPDVFTGKLAASGSFTAYDSTGTLRDFFLNESDISILMFMTAGAADNADFVSMLFGQVKVNSASADDPETGRKLTCAWAAQYNATGGVGLASDATTVVVQDSSLVGLP